jgi:anti-sigma B factor antagonist
MNEPVRMGEQPEVRLRIAITQANPDLVVLSLSGDLDLLTSPLLHERLWPLLGQPDGRVVVDLSEVGFLGSAGLAELAAAHDTGTRQGVRIVLVASTRAVLRPLEVTGLHTLFPMFDSVESALRDL